MLKSKKFFLVSLIIFLTVSLFWGIYYFAFRQKEIATEKTSQTEKVSTESNSKSDLIQITESAVVSPILGEDGATINYYLKETGKPFQTDLSGNNTKSVPNAKIEDLKSVLWSPTMNKVIGIKNNGIISFDLNENKDIDLNENIQSIAWQSQNKIIYTFKNNTSSSGTLNIADWDGNNWKKMADLDFFGQKLSPIPRSGIISFWNNPDANYESKLQTISLATESKEIIFSGVFGADYLWSPSGKKFLVSYAKKEGGKNITLGTADVQGKNFVGLNFPSFVSKCVWSSNSIDVFCALPGSLPEESILPNDYINNKFFTTDTFWKINTETGKRDRIIELEKINKEIDATDLFLNQDESMLFFVNKRDDLLYRINL